MRILHKFRFIFYFFIVIISIILLAPKTYLYYSLEHIIAKQKIYINNEKTSNSLLFFNIKNAIIYYEDIKIAKIKNMSLLSLLFANSINISNIKITKHLKDFVPSKLDDMHISYSVISPTKIHINSNGALGDLQGYIHLIDKKLIISYLPSKIIKTKYSKILSLMKLEKGAYKYEYKFR